MKKEFKLKNYHEFFDEGAVDYPNRESLFIPPVTTRVYLHPAMSERMFTLWRGGKLLFGEVVPKFLMEYYDIVSVGLVFLHGEKMEAADHTAASYSVREDSVPIFTLNNKYGELDVSVEAFGSEGLKSSLFSKVTLKNNTENAVKEKFGFILREERECLLVGGAPDVYCSYKENVAEWKEDFDATFKDEGGALRSGEYTLRVKGAELSFDEASGIASREFSLASGEEVSFTICLDMGEREDFDYEEEKRAAVSYWHSELAKMTKIPERIRENEERCRSIKSMAVTLLQCLCRPKGTDMTLCRQGGLQRSIWVYEAMFALEALCRIGEFRDYVRQVLSLYFDKCMEESGEVITLGIPWAMATGQAIMSFANYALAYGEDAYEEFREKAYKAFLWMKRTRASSLDTENTVKGLFPPMASCDCQFVFQSWHTTDGNNLIGLEKYLQAAERFGDPRLNEIREEYLDYRRVMNMHFEAVKKKYEGKDELFIPLAPRGNDEELRAQFSFGGSHMFLVGALCPKSEDIERILLAHGRRGGMHDNLYDRMPGKNMRDPDGVSRVWYIVAHEYQVFSALMKIGERERAGELLASMLKYGLTSEYYSMERMHERDPYFAPWMPNASNNGRYISALCEYYK